MRRCRIRKFSTKWDQKSENRVELAVSETAWQILEEVAQNKAISKSELIELYARSLKPDSFKTEQIEALERHFHSSPSYPTQQAPLKLQPEIQQLDIRVEELLLIANALPVLISYIDAQQCYRFNNKAYEELFGYSRTQLYGKHIKEVVGESVYKSIQTYIETALSGQEIAFERRVFSKEGQIRDIRTTYVPHRGKSRTVEGFVALISDISEHKQVEQALRESEARFRAAAEGSFDAIYLLESVRDAAGEIIDFKAIDLNGRGERLMSQPREAIINKRLCELSPVNQPEGSFEKYKQVVETGIALEEEFAIAAPGVNAKWLHNQVVPLGDGIAITSRDITERKQVEAERAQLLRREQAARAQAEAANRSKDEFLGILSHELRTPLNAMLGWTHILRTRQLNEAIVTYAIEVVDRNTRVLSRLIEDLLDISQIMTDKLWISQRRVALVSVIEAALDKIRPLADAKNIRIDCSLDALKLTVSGDPDRLQQVMWNLLSNAVKFTPAEGRIEVRLSLEMREGEAPPMPYAQIQVIDTGVGIGADFLPHVFDRFRQADSSTTRAFGGLGLGLAIARYLVELHGGTIEVESLGIGQGTTFTVKLPL